MRFRRKRRRLKALDLFAGVGGSSHGAKRAGVSVVAAVDAWQIATNTYRDNFPTTKIYEAQCEQLRPAEVRSFVGKIDLLLASPECTSHTCAKGAGQRSERSRETAFQVIRFARVFRPRWIVVENVVHMRRWRRYRAWLMGLEQLGYKYREQVLNACDFGVPQSRRRLFVTFDLRRVPREIPPPKRQRAPSAADIIDMNGTYSYSVISVGRPRRRRRWRALNARSKVSTDGSRFCSCITDPMGRGGGSDSTFH